MSVGICIIAHFLGPPKLGRQRIRQTGVDSSRIKWIKTDCKKHTMYVLMLNDDIATLKVITAKIAKILKHFKNIRVRFCGEHKKFLKMTEK